MKGLLAIDVGIGMIISIWMVMHIEEDDEANIDEGTIGNMDVSISIMDAAFEKDETDRGKAFKKSVSEGH